MQAISFSGTSRIRDPGAGARDLSHRPRRQNRFASINAEYTERIEPRRVIRALQALQESPA